MTWARKDGCWNRGCVWRRSSKSSSDAIIAKTMKGFVTSWNGAAEAMFGFSQQEMVGQSIIRIIPDPKRREEADLIARVAAGERITRHDTVRQRKDGAEVRVSLSLSPIADAGGEIVGVSSIMRDVTEEYRAREHIAELQAAQIRLSRLGAIGGIWAAISHEVMQPLTALRNYSAALARLVARSDVDLQAIGTAAAEIGRQVDRVAGTIHRVRNFVGNRQVIRKDVAINDLINDALQLTHWSLPGRNLPIRSELHPTDRALINADRVQIEQVLVNLLNNAIEATEGRPDRLVAVATRLIGDDRIGIEVEDNGPGLAQEMASRLFAPFLTSNASGLGMGLSISREIAQAHGGEVRYMPRHAGGSVFTLELPLASASEPS